MLFYPKFDHLTRHNFWTTYRKKVIDPSLESPGILLYWEKHLKSLPCFVFAYVSIFSAIFCQKQWYDVTWRHVTSHDPIFTKFMQSAFQVHILLVAKDEVICMGFAEVTAIYFLAHNISFIEINDVTYPRQTPINIEWRIEMTQNCQEMYETKFYPHKNRLGPSARANFSFVTFLYLGGCKFIYRENIEHHWIWGIVWPTHLICALMVPHNICHERI